MRSAAKGTIFEENSEATAGTTLKKHAEEYETVSR
jgi:hypothetical protein